MLKLSHDKSHAFYDCFGRIFFVLNSVRKFKFCKHLQVSCRTNVIFMIIISWMLFLVGSCPLLSNLGNGSLTYSHRRRIWRTSANYRCNSGFAIRGLSFRTCRSDRQWSGRKPICTGLLERNFEWVSLKFTNILKVYWAKNTKEIVRFLKSCRLMQTSVCSSHKSDDIFYIFLSFKNKQINSLTHCTHYLTFHH